MKTGHDATQPAHCHAHRMAIVTGATSVFLRDLCRDMAWLRTITGDTDVPGIAKACACRIMQSAKYNEIESIVDKVLAHDDGMPEIENRPLLAEIMACYSMASRAEREGTASDFRQNMLVPAIVEEAMETKLPEEEEAVAFVNSINHYYSLWDTYLPSTPFQIIVHDAINRIVI